MDAYLLLAITLLEVQLCKSSAHLHTDLDFEQSSFLTSGCSDIKYAKVREHSAAPQLVRLVACIMFASLVASKITLHRPKQPNTKLSVLFKSP